MFKTSMLRSDLFDYSDAYIGVKGRNAVGTADANVTNKNLSFKNNDLFRSCMSEINNTFIDNADDLDTVMSMNGLFYILSCFVSTFSRFICATSDLFKSKRYKWKRSWNGRKRIHG